MTLNKKLLLTLLLFFFTTSFFEGMNIKSLATCQGPSRRQHIQFMMIVTGRGSLQFLLLIDAG